MDLLEDGPALNYMLCPSEFGRQPQSLALPTYSEAGKRSLLRHPGMQG